VFFAQRSVPEPARTTKRTRGPARNNRHCGGKPLGGHLEVLARVAQAPEAGSAAELSAMESATSRATVIAT
jgi:hypothetical protein